MPASVRNMLRQVVAVDVEGEGPTRDEESSSRDNVWSRVERHVGGPVPAQIKRTVAVHGGTQFLGMINVLTGRASPAFDDVRPGALPGGVMMNGVDVRRGRGGSEHGARRADAQSASTLLPTEMVRLEMWQSAVGDVVEGAR